jgi:hypothetical protein
MALARGFSAFCGGLVIYIAVGGLAGFVLLFALNGRHTKEPSCLPFSTVFAQITSECPASTVKMFWAATLGLPRLLITFPALATTFYKTELGTTSCCAGANHWARFSIPVLLLIGVGTAYWWKRHRGIAAALLAVIVGQILFLF